VIAWSFRCPRTDVAGHDTDLIWREPSILLFRGRNFDFMDRWGVDSFVFMIPPCFPGLDGRFWALDDTVIRRARYR
jgi:hypothetical protein